MGVFTAITREVDYLSAMLRVLGQIKKVGPASGLRVPDHIEKTVDRFADRPMAITEDGSVSYAQFDAYANQVAHWALEKGMKPGETVALFMTNRWEYIAIWFGLSKVGLVTSLINNQLQGQSLAHCLTIGQTSHAIVEASLADAYLSAEAAGGIEAQAWSVDGEFAGSRDFNSALQTQSMARPDVSVRATVKSSEPVLKMFTSGTTGLPKAALMTHVRALYYLNIFAIAAKCTEQDRMMMVLPLYHATGGLCGVGCALSYGGALVIRPKFSASAFWPDTVRFGATLFMYVGELCRFLVNSPEVPEEHAHSLRCAIGNGMRRDVWEQFQERFKLPQIVEFYGSTEGNVGLVNATNQAGAIGRVPSYLRSRFNIDLVKFDLESEMPLRGANGYCVTCAPDEVGEAIGRIDPDDARFRFDGYGSEEDTEKKILRNVFKPGDAWFRTGDLMTRDALGYYYFVDRVGDTYRWKSENVSTGEVAEALNFDGIEQANVYGVEVQGHAGRAGMAALVAGHHVVDLEALHEHIHRALPAFARPLFLRLQQQTDTTGTFKLRKVELVKEGFDPDQIEDPLYVDHPVIGKYVRLTRELYEQIVDGRLRV
ncbi:long-chain-acyl-CoA synthetase [uncultured Maricaulis sp.]|uniref:long-chain-acyl-CoA synthetase n=1 Tax=uncultured Maricaulis sp. TaxID=174710 RepID=UPI0030DA2EF1|tara:strand:+ start:283989 stop:285782 length:1794 start_codon:yes stop_codon:yes gene_type:complete